METVFFDNVTKLYKTRAAVSSVSLAINSGEIFGLIGPNGVGKTTLIKIAAGLVKPTEGDVLICGKSVRFEHEAAIAKIGGIIENPELFRSMSGLDNLKYFAMLYGNIGMDRINEVVALVKLENRIKDKVKTYSLGMRQRLGIAQALLHRPALLLLDEPTNGLDPAGIKETREVLQALCHNEGTSVIISSHILKEMELLVDRFAIMNNGRILSINTSSDVRTKNRRLSLSTNDNESALELLKQTFKDTPSYIDDDIIYIMLDAADAKHVSKLIVNSGLELNHIMPEVDSLEDYYISTIGDNGVIV